MQIAIPLFPEFTALDCIGPYEILQRLPGATVAFVGETKGEIRADNGFLGMTVDHTFDEVSNPDVVVVPGGVGTRAFCDGEEHAILAWLRQAHETTTFTTSVCTGSHLLAAAGLVSGLAAATHWATYDELERLGATSTSQRVVEHLEQRVITAAGVSSGIDMALRLAELLVDADAAKAMQLMTEYDPQPPFDAGNVDGAGDAVIARVIEYSKSKK